MHPLPHQLIVSAERAKRQFELIPCHRCSDAIFFLLFDPCASSAQHLSVDNLSFVAGLRGGPISASETGEKTQLRALLSKPESSMEDVDVQEV